MERVVTKTIVRFRDDDNDQLTEFGREIDMVNVEDYRRIGSVPDEPYQVIYALSPTGQFKVGTTEYFGWRCLEDHGGCYVCFIPRTWIGKRVNRWVVPLSAARRTK